MISTYINLRVYTSTSTSTSVSVFFTVFVSAYKGGCRSWSDGNRYHRSDARPPWETAVCEEQCPAPVLLHDSAGTYIDTHSVAYSVIHL
jgi:hypothetical protein